MRKTLGRRPSPSLVISLLALFVALGGTSYAVTKINGKNIKKGTIPGDRVKKKGITATQIKDNAITGAQINEAKLGLVAKAKAADTAATATSATTATNAANADNAKNAASAADSAKLGGKGPADFVGTDQSRRILRKLSFGETVELVSSGPVALDAVCSSASGTDRIAVKARTSVAGAVLGGEDDLNGGATPASFLNPETLPDDRDLAEDSTATGTVSVDTEIDEGFVMAPDTSAILANSEGIVLGLNYGGANCVVAGVFDVVKP